MSGPQLGFQFRVERIAAGVTIEVYDPDVDAFCTVAIADGERAIDQAMHGLAALFASSVKAWAHNVPRPEK